MEEGKKVIKNERGWEEILLSFLFLTFVPTPFGKGMGDARGERAMFKFKAFVGGA